MGHAEPVEACGQVIAHPSTGSGWRHTLRKIVIVYLSNKLSLKKNQFMIIGIGTDIVEVARIAKSIEKAAFKKKVFSETEIVYCETKKNKAESFAARFAAKEAFFKALGTGWRDGMAFNEVVISNDTLGKPSLNVVGKTARIIAKKNIKTIHVSLSHTREIALATVILEGKEK